MSCPDWNALITHRDTRGEDPAGWSEALAHLEGCSGCRPLALTLDPTLVFRRMAAPRVSEEDVESMLHSVRALRRAQELAPLPAASGLDGLRHRPRLVAIGRLAAAVALVAVGLTLGPTQSLGPMGSSRTAPPVVAAVESFAAGDAELVEGSYIEDLDLPDARVYQLAAEETQVVMIVHPSLDL